MTSSARAWAIGSGRPGAASREAEAWRAVGKTTVTDRDGFEVEIEIETGEGAELRVKHYPNDGSDDPVEYTVPLTCTAPRFGGLRWWLRCPATRRRCSKV